LINQALVDPALVDPALVVPVDLRVPAWPMVETRDPPAPGGSRIDGVG
jgi:hypothetical protein